MTSLRCWGLGGGGGRPVSAFNGGGGGVKAGVLPGGRAAPGALKGVGWERWTRRGGGGMGRPVLIRDGSKTLMRGVGQEQGHWLGEGGQGVAGPGVSERRAKGC